MTEFTSCDDCTDNMKQSNCSICIHNNMGDFFEFKPKQKTIKLDEMVGSDIDCEFTDSEGHWIIGKLKAIWGELQMPYDSGSKWEKCRIRQDHPHANIWTECPLPEGLEIVVIYYGGGVSGSITDYHNINWAEVSRFYVYGPADTHRYEYQKEKEE